LFDGIWKVSTDSSFAGETHRMKAEDKTATILLGSRNLEPSTHLFGIAQKEMDSSIFLGKRGSGETAVFADKLSTEENRVRLRTLNSPSPQRALETPTLFPTRSGQGLCL
jgi:hypothetical protein